MPDPTSFRLSETEIAFIRKYGGLKNALERLQYLEDNYGESEPQDNAPECHRRLHFNGKTYCVQTTRKGLMRLREIPTPEVCTICIEEHWNIPKETRAEKPQPQQWTETDHKVSSQAAHEAMKRIKNRSNNIDMGNSEGVEEPDYHEGYR